MGARTIYNTTIEYDLENHFPLFLESNAFFWHHYSFFLLTVITVTLFPFLIISNSPELTICSVIWTFYINIFLGNKKTLFIGCAMETFIFFLFITKPNPWPATLITTLLSASALGIISKHFYNVTLKTHKET